MKTLILSLCVVMTSVHYQVFVASDRLFHLIGSLLLTLFLSKLDKGYITTIAVVFSIGLAKELRDPVFDPLDMLANCVGILIGILL